MKGNRLSVGGAQPGRTAANVGAAFTITGERELPR